MNWERLEADGQWLVHYLDAPQMREKKNLASVDV